MKSSAALSSAAAIGVLVCAWSGDAAAAGVLRPANSSHQPIEILDHKVEVVINNGFSRTEVTQTFHNPNASDVDAVYEFPVPPNAALSEMEILVGDRVLRGEVVERARAQRIFDEQAGRGSQVGLAEKNGYQNFRFSVAAVPANGNATMSFVYYETATIDTGVGRFHYPLEHGGTDDGAGFWTGQNSSTGSFSFDLELKSAAPVAEVRVPDVPMAAIDELEPGHFKIHFDAAPGTLGQDVVAYYKLEEDLPGRVEVVPYRSAARGPGTFMMIVTPGIDLPAIEHGTDYVYVLDVSGSMETKLDTLKSAVVRALSELGPEDRFRLIGFSESAFELTNGFLDATPDNVAAASEALRRQGTLGGTDLYSGLSAGLRGPDPERVTSIFLVTDAVANQGFIEPVQFDSLMRESDVRVFGFLMGNSANWPLMEIITQASGGFYAPVSNQDDVLGQVLLAKSKLTHDSLHDARLALSGVAVSETTDFDFGKVYRGQQLVVFGRYAAGGEASMSLSTRIRGLPKTYSTNFTFPDVAEHSPELERLWALEMIFAVQKQALLGLMPANEASAKVRELGLQYQLVTDETSMIVLDDAGFEEHGVERNNRTRTATEQGAQGNGTSPPPTDPGAGNPFPDSSASLGNDGHAGALDAGSIGLLLLSLLGLGARRSRRAAAEGE